jgi:NADH-quinone oxidoreductase subunit A
LPWAVSMRDLGVYGLAVMAVFTFILVVGFAYEWKKGGLEWE